LDRRHNLNKLVTETAGKGLLLTPETQEGIKALAEANVKSWRRYPRDDGKVEVFVIERSTVSLEVRGISCPSGIINPVGYAIAQGAFSKMRADVMNHLAILSNP
jgi:hypothetical protein